MNKNLEKSSQNLNKNLKKNAKKDEAKLEFHLHSKPLEKLHSYQNLNTNSSKISNVNFKENLNKNNKNQGTNLSNQAQILNAPNLNSVQISQAKQNILDFTKAEFEAKFDKKFRVKQIFEWIYQKYADDFSQMSSLPKNLREELAQIYHFSPLKCVKFEQSKDKSVKYLFRLNDGLMIESVLLPMKEEQTDSNGKISKHARYTICVSSQVGCKSGCSFCLTAKGGLKRNLSAGEIVGQILWIKKHHKIPYERRVNIVYMGMGEPLDNLANVSKADRKSVV